MIQLKSPKHSRKFDAVRTLLEKARQKLLRLTAPQKNTQKFEKESHSSTVETKFKMGESTCRKDGVKNLNIAAIAKCSNAHHGNLSDTLGTQSSPVTPAEIRRKCPKIRNRSFSPVRFVINTYNNPVQTIVILC